MKYMLLFFSVGLLLMACGKEGPVGPKGPVGVSYTWPPSEINGYAFLRSQYGTPLLTSDSVLVRTYNGQYWFSAYSDKKGFWQLRKMPPGNYDISLTKPGFDSLHIFVQHAGGQEPKFVGDDTLYASMDLHVSAIEWSVVPAGNSVFNLQSTIHYTGGTDSNYHKPIIYLSLYYIMNGVEYNVRTFGDVASADPAFVPGKVTTTLPFTIFSPPPAGDSIFVRVNQGRPNNFPYTKWYSYPTDSLVSYPYGPGHPFQSGIQFWPSLQ